MLQTFGEVLSVNGHLRSYHIPLTNVSLTLKSALMTRFGNIFTMSFDMLYVSLNLHLPLRIIPTPHVIANTHMNDFSNDHH